MKGSVRDSARQIVVVTVFLAAGACSAPRPDKDVTNPDPAGKIPAYKAAVRAKDRGAAAQMVEDLDSDDPAVRMFAIVALRRMTGGQTFGYQYFQDDDDQRRAAIQRWERWLAGEESDEPQQDATAGSSGATDAPNPASGP